ncbi:MAG: hypothetical protein BWY52_02359 [Chloroflexi bacterium ADurb.Bin325]|nr:MAG: hypothetical protein BWY52_02359 [Chloroflexi bacterium ADurb.Bin325]
MTSPDARILLVDDVRAQDPRGVRQADGEAIRADVQIGHGHGDGCGDVVEPPTVRQGQGQRLAGRQPARLVIEQPVQQIRARAGGGRGRDRGRGERRAGARGRDVDPARARRGRVRGARGGLQPRLAGLGRDLRVDDRQILAPIPDDAARAEARGKIIGGELAVAEDDPGAAIRGQPVIDDLPLQRAVAVVPRAVMQDVAAAVGRAAERGPVHALQARRVPVELEQHRVAHVAEGAPGRILGPLRQHVAGALVRVLAIRVDVVHRDADGRGRPEVVVQPAAQLLAADPLARPGVRHRDDGLVGEGGVGGLGDLAHEIHVCVAAHRLLVFGQDLIRGVAPAGQPIAAYGRLRIPERLAGQHRLALALHAHRDPHRGHLGVAVVALARRADELDHPLLERAVVAQRLVVVARSRHLEREAVGVVLHPGRQVQAHVGVIRAPRRAVAGRPIPPAARVGEGAGDREDDGLGDDAAVRQRDGALAGCVDARVVRAPVDGVPVVPDAGDADVAAGAEIRQTVDAEDLVARRKWVGRRARRRHGVLRDAPGDIGAREVVAALAGRPRQRLRHGRGCRAGGGRHRRAAG